MATREEILNAAFPKTVGGMVRPDEPVQTDWDFSTEFPQFLRNDLNLGDQENAFLRQLLSNDKIMKTLINAIRDQLANCDLRIVTETLKGLMDPEMLKKLNGIQAGALNNPHPSTHPATMITQDATHRFVTDTEKTTWNNKANAGHGNHVPAPQTADNSKFLRNDNSWQAVTPGNIGAYTKAEVDTRVNVKANLNNPKFTGTPTAPTASAATNNTQIATTAFVKAAATAANCGGIVGGSLAQNGWVKFANGLILQWGRLAFTDNTGITFPVAFSSENYIVVATECNSVNWGSSASVFGTHYQSATGFAIQGRRITGDSVSTGIVTAAWLALGR